MQFRKTPFNQMLYNWLESVKLLLFLVCLAFERFNIIYNRNIYLSINNENPFGIIFPMGKMYFSQEFNSDR